MYIVFLFVCMYMNSSFATCLGGRAPMGYGSIYREGSATFDDVNPLHGGESTSGKSRNLYGHSGNSEGTTDEHHVAYTACLNTLMSQAAEEEEEEGHWQLYRQFLLQRGPI